MTELTVHGFAVNSNSHILQPTDHGPSSIAIELLAHLRASAKPMTAAVTGAARA